MIINEDTKLDIYNSKRKNSADDTMVSPGITDRFEDDVANDEGDWGKTQKKYAPGPTYEEDKMAEYKDNPRFKKKCPASNGKHDWEWVERKGKMFGSCDNCGAEHPQNKKLKEEIVIDNLLRAVLMEAQSFDPQSTEHTEDPITACSVCGVKGHVPAKHFGRALAGENNQPVKEAVTKKKQLLFGDEKPREVKCIKCKGKFTYTPKDSVEMRQLCDTCGKKPLKEGMKFSRQHDTPEKAEAHKESLVKQGVKAWVNHSHDGTHHTFWMQEDEQKVSQQSIDEAKKKKWDKIKHVAAIARTTIGPIKKGQVITPKKERKEKYKVDYMKEEGEESKHAYAARKHDEAAEHAGSEGRVIDRPYKDAVRASEQTKHPRINEYIRNTSARWGGDPIPHSGGRKAWHTKLAQMHRDADKE